MALGYQGTSGGDIGTLLRMIQEEQSSSALATPPAAEPGSPIRELTQGPILAPESPGTSRVASLRPEGIASSPVDLQPGSVVPPVAPVAPVAAPIGPVNPGSPGVSSPVASRPASQSVSATFPSIGTSIKAPSYTAKPSAQPVAQSFAPLRKTTLSATPSTSKFGGSGAIGGTVGAVAKLAPKILPTILKGAAKATGGGLLDVGGYLKAIDNIRKTGSISKAKTYKT